MMEPTGARDRKGVGARPHPAVERARVTRLGAGLTPSLTCPDVLARVRAIFRQTSDQRNRSKPPRQDAAA